VSLIALLGTSAALAVPAKASPDDDLRALAAKLVRWNSRGEWQKSWAFLHPRYQAVTTRAFWVACQQKRDAAGPSIVVRSVTIGTPHLSSATLPLLGQTDLTLVKVTLRYSIAGSKKLQSVTGDSKWTQYRGEWRGLWDAKTYQSYSHHRCPG